MDEERSRSVGDGEEEVKEDSDISEDCEEDVEQEVDSEDFSEAEEVSTD